MSDKTYQNINLVKTFYRRLSGGHLYSACEALHPDIEWTEPDLPGLWFSGTRWGSKAVLNEIIAPVTEKLQGFRVKLKKLFPVRKLDAAAAHVWTLRDGKAVRFAAFHDALSWQQALPELQTLAA